MRVPMALLVLAFAAPVAGANANADKAKGADSAPAPQCARTTSHLAHGKDLYHGKPLTPRKLNELPPATAYMAVYRRIGGCEAPLTMVDYRNPRRR